MGSGSSSSAHSSPENSNLRQQINGNSNDNSVYTTEERLFQTLNKQKSIPIQLSFHKPPAILLYGPPIFPVMSTSMFLSKKLKMPVLSSNSWTEKSLQMRINQDDCLNGFIICLFPMNVRDLLMFESLIPSFFKIAFFLGVDIQPEVTPEPAYLFGIADPESMKSEDALTCSFYEYKNQEAIVKSYLKAEKGSYVYQINAKGSPESQILETLGKLSMNASKEGCRRPSAATTA